MQGEGFTITPFTTSSAIGTAQFFDGGGAPDYEGGRAPNVGGTGQSGVLGGGKYIWTIGTETWLSEGTISLMILGPDGVTKISAGVAAAAAAGSVMVDLPPGPAWVVTTTGTWSTDIHSSLVRAPS